MGFAYRLRSIESTARRQPGIAVTVGAAGCLTFLACFSPNPARADQPASEKGDQACAVHKFSSSDPQSSVITAQLAKFIDNFNHGKYQFSTAIQPKSAAASMLYGTEFASMWGVMTVEVNSKAAHGQPYDTSTLTAFMEQLLKSEQSIDALAKSEPDLRLSIAYLRALENEDCSLRFPVALPADAVADQVSKLISLDKPTAAELSAFTRIYTQMLGELERLRASNQDASVYRAIEILLEEISFSHIVHEQAKSGGPAGGPADDITSAQLQEMDRRAADGNVDMMMLDGIARLNGPPRIRDTARGMAMLEKAANAGSVLAMQELSAAYSGRFGVKRDDAVSMSWTVKAAEGGLPDAMMLLGERYHFGEHIEKDDAKAFQWMRRAAESGQSQGMLYLGTFYEAGIGTEKSIPNAILWYTKAADQGNADALNNIGSLWGRGEGVEKNQSKAMDYYSKAAAAGSSTGDLNVALMYLNGIGVPRDRAKAISLMQQSAKMGNADAAARLAKLR